METIGEKIRSLRKSKGISQTTISDACGIKQSSYANIENGKTQNITIEIGKGISKALDIHFNELFEIEAPLSSDGFNEIGKLWDALKEKNKALEEKDLLIALLRKEKETNKLIVLNTITRYSNHVLSFLNADMRNASSEIERNIFERQIIHELKNKQDMFQNLISLGFITQDDLDDFNKEREEIYELFGKIQNRAIKDMSEILPVSDQERLMLKSDKSFVPERFKTDDGRPFIRKDIEGFGDGLNITFTHPDQEQKTKDAEETVRILYNIYDEKIKYNPDKVVTHMDVKNK